MEDFEIENGVLTEYQGEDVDVIVPEGVREIGEGAFWRCDVESVRLPQGIRAIRSEAFMNCRSLRRINLPESVRTIETEAFHGSGLRAIRLPVWNGSKAPRSGGIFPGSSARPARPSGAFPCAAAAICSR